MDAVDSEDWGNYAAVRAGRAAPESEKKIAKGVGTEGTEPVHSPEFSEKSCTGKRRGRTTLFSK